MQRYPLKFGIVDLGLAALSLCFPSILEKASLRRCRALYDADKEWNPNRIAYPACKLRESKLSLRKFASPRGNRFLFGRLGAARAGLLVSAERRTNNRPDFQSTD